MNTQQFDSVSFVGGGRVTHFLLEGWKVRGVLPTQILVCDPDQTAIRKLKMDFPSVGVRTLSELKQSPLIVLAVHPPDLKTVLNEFGEGISESTIVLSLAPKIKIAAIQAALGIEEVVRMIPNAPSAIGQGYNPVTYPLQMDDATIERLDHLFAPWGRTPKVPEDHLEAYAIVSGMGPTYMWFQWQTLTNLAVDMGLTREAASEALLQTVSGSVELLLASGRASEEVMDMVPVKPLESDEASIRHAYSSRLLALYQKLHG